MGVLAWARMFQNTPSSDGEEPSAWDPQDLPEVTEDGRYQSFDDACSACKIYNSQSCQTYTTCNCFAGDSDAFDNEAFAKKVEGWRFGCNVAGAGLNYKKCFDNDSAVHVDLFGDKVDPNNPRC